MTKSDFASAKSTSFDKIPIIDISEIYTENGFEKVANELVQTARSIGFFYIKGHGVSLDLITQAFKASKMFFELPLEKKASIKVDVNQRGWMGKGMTKLEGAKTHDSKEDFFWGWDAILMFYQRALIFFFNNIHTKLNTFITNEYCWACYKFSNFMLAFSTK